MGDKTWYTRKYYRLTTAQKNRIKPTSQSGEWYKDVDKDTGIIRWLRKKAKMK